jgi:signal-transduction protein with cAMP-binding, CBS, and nucleotidyltransferase domain
MKSNQLLKARDVMTKGIIFIDGMATAKDAAELMRREKTDALIVKKRHPDDAYGILVVHDLIKGVVIADNDSTEVNVFEMMTKPVISVPASMDIRYVARLLIRANIRRAPVEENGEYIGMISLTSLILDNMLF